MDRQKLLMIFGAAWISAALLTWFLYAKTKAPKTDKMIQIVAAASDLPAGAKLHKGNVRMITIREQDRPAGALTSIQDVNNRTLLYPVSANEPITTNRLASLSGAEGIAATIEPGMRAVSVPFTDSSGVSGLIQPRSRVDVLFTKSGSLTEALTTTILEDVQVLSIGRTTEVQNSAAAAAKAGVNRSQNQTATLMVDPEQAKILELAKNSGRIGLALRNPMDRSKLPEGSQAATADQIDPLLLTIRGRRVKGGPPLDRKSWANLVGDEERPKPPPKPEPPKPKLIVDIYRGDKHVQEIFQ